MTDGARARLPSDFEKRAKAIRWLVLDVDGVLSEQLWYSTEGEAFKPFDVKDGLGLRAAASVGLRLAILTARSSHAVAKRADDLGFDDVMLGSKNKRISLEEFLERHGVETSAVAAMGDDLPDLSILDRAGLSFAPATPARDVRARVDVVVKQVGGRGAVREMIELLLEARGEWQTVVARFLDE